MGAVDMIHPDLASSGGLIETKKIGDYAMEHGVAMAMHFAGTPVSFMANVHCAAATENFVALEHHSHGRALVGEPRAPPRRQAARREAASRVVPDAPGLGVELNEEVVRQHLRAGSSLLRADAAVGQGTQLGPDVELTAGGRGGTMTEVSRSIGLS